MMRIELTPSAWKAEALPICNIRKAGLAGLDPANFRLTVECCTNSATDQNINGQFIVIPRTTRKSFTCPRIGQS